MNVETKILSEIQRYWEINKYITEQEVTEPETAPPNPISDLGAVAPPEGVTTSTPPPPSQPTEPQPIDVNQDDEVEKIDDEGNSEEEGSDSEELDITDLVDSQKKIQEKQDEYFDNLFGQVARLESKLSEMDNILMKLNDLETKVEKYRQKTPEEKLELRSFDSYPFNQKLSDFFVDKTEEMQKSGKNEYVLTPDDVTDINPQEIKSSFSPGNLDV